MVIVINQLPTKEKFDLYVKMGLLQKQVHPELPLTIYNYSILTNFDRLWNTVTRQARGIVFDDKGRCVIRCMYKFFNEDEPHALCDMPKESPVYFNKLDGSLIQVVNDKDYGLIVSSKGSFASKQAKWAKEYIDAHYEPEDFQQGLTYVFELIHPDNRIVVNYGNNFCIYLLAVIDIETGKEFNIYSNKFNFFTKVQIVSDIDAHMALDDVEGMVVKTGDHRYKVKTGEYIRLHRVMTDFTPKRVWECMKAGTSLEFQDMPEEFTTWLNGTIEDLQSQYDQIDAEIYTEFVKSKGMTAKEIGLSDFKWKNQIFSIMNGRDYSESIWKRIKPNDVGNVDNEQHRIEYKQMEAIS